MKFILLALLLLTIQPVNAKRSKEERKSLFNSATERLRQTGIENKVLKVGDKFPDFKLGEKKVSQWIKEKPLVVTFYRGGWCPYCVKQLKEIEQELTQLNSIAGLIAISPEQEVEVRKTKNKNNLKFLLLSDKYNTLASQLGLVFKVEDEVVSEYEALGISLKDSQGNQKNELPMPATFVIGRDQKVHFVFADADYTKRASLEDIFKVLKNLK